MNGQPAVAYGIQQTRITLMDPSGVNTSRILLQAEMNEGLSLAFKPEGIAHDLGSGAGWARRWIHRGFRTSLSIKWDLGVTSQIQAWDGSAWGAYAQVNTAQALGIILNASSTVSCLVEPHQDMNFAFQAQPDPGKSLVLSDTKKFAHRNLTLDLVSSGLLSIPDWTTVNNYFSPGYISSGYIGWMP